MRHSCFYLCISIQFQITILYILEDSCGSIGDLKPLITLPLVYIFLVFVFIYITSGSNIRYSYDQLYIRETDQRTI